MGQIADQKQQLFGATATQRSFGGFAACIHNPPSVLTFIVHEADVG